MGGLFARLNLGQSRTMCQARTGIRSSVASRSTLTYSRRRVLICTIRQNTMAATFPQWCSSRMSICFLPSAWHALIPRYCEGAPEGRLRSLFQLEVLREAVGTSEPVRSLEIFAATTDWRVRECQSYATGWALSETFAGSNGNTSLVIHLLFYSSLISWLG